MLAGGIALSSPLCIHLLTTWFAMGNFFRLRREHPLFFWGMAVLIAGLLAASAAVAIRIPAYRDDAEQLNARMTEAERAARDRILDAQTRRLELAVALMRREYQLKALEDQGLHLALSVGDSTLALRHGPATLRVIPVTVGSDSIIRAPNGRTWRFIRALGERHLTEKAVGATYQVPEWVYVSRGEPAPPEAQRQVPGGLGYYVLRLDDGTEIYSEPEIGPLVGGVKPASFMASEQDLKAIFDAVSPQTPVYIY